MGDWAIETEAAISTGLRGFDQVAALVDAGFGFFERNRDLRALLRLLRAALEPPEATRA